MNRKDGPILSLTHVPICWPRPRSRVLESPPHHHLFQLTSYLLSSPTIAVRHSLRRVSPPAGGTSRGLGGSVLRSPVGFRFHCGPRFGRHRRRRLRKGLFPRVDIPRGSRISGPPIQSWFGHLRSCFGQFRLGRGPEHRFGGLPLRNFCRCVKDSDAIRTNPGGWGTFGGPN